MGFETHLSARASTQRLSFNCVKPIDITATELNRLTLYS